MAGKIKFGTDGWRGIIAEDFTFENVRRAALATAEFVQQNRFTQPGPILVGYDRRFFSREFARCVAETLQSRGLTARLSRQPMPTPAVSVAVVKDKASWGIMITASHNPAIYNGFKIKESKGRSAPPEATEDIERLLPSVQLDVPAAAAEKPAEFDYWTHYEAYLKERLDWRALKRFRARVVFDHLHGVAAGIPEKLLKGSALTITSLHAEADPLFGGLHPEPIDGYVGALQAAVRKQKAIAGFAFDGDADRLGVVDNQGTYLTPHQVFPLLTLYCIEQKGWRGKIVQSVSLGALGERIAKAYHLAFEEVPVGFKHVAERIITQDILAGGEESGGYAFKGGLPERDGILSALFFLEMLAVTGKTPVQLLQSMEKRFGAARFKRLDIPLARPISDKARFAEEISSRLPGRLLNSSVSDVRTGDGVKIILENGSWVLLRPSGTEPLLRTYAETPAWKQTDALLDQARRWVQEVVR